MSRASVAKRDLRRESGIASILVTMIIMIVISLIVLAAAQLARRGQRQALDRQLSTQAYYAAESGVNDVVETIGNDVSSGGTLADTDYTDRCNGPGSFIEAANPDLAPSLGASVSYSCLLVDPTPTTWEGTVGDTSRTTPLRPKDGTSSISSVTIAWQANDGNDDFTNCTTTNFDPIGSRACKTPVLRFDLVSTANPTRANLNENVMTVFLIPNNGSIGGTTFPFDISSPSGAQTGFKQTVSCHRDSTPKYCVATITGLSGANYYLRMKSIYGSSSVTVSAQNALNTKYELKDSQIVVDSTGKASDVLRRIQVRVPFTGALNIPEFAIESGDSICKRLLVTGAAATDSQCGL